MIDLVALGRLIFFFLSGESMLFLRIKATCGASRVPPVLKSTWSDLKRYVLRTSLTWKTGYIRNDLRSRGIVNNITVLLTLV